MSWLAADDASAFHWRQDFIATFLQRDLTALGLGLRVPAETLCRLLTGPGGRGPCKKDWHRDKNLASPKLTQGFWLAMQHMPIDRAFVVAPVLRRYLLATGMEVVPVCERHVACRQPYWRQTTRLT